MALKVAFSPSATEEEYLAAMFYMVGDPKDVKMAGEVLKQSRAPRTGAIQYKAASKVSSDAWWSPAENLQFLALQGSNDQTAPSKNGAVS